MSRWVYGDLPTATHQVWAGAMELTVEGEAFDRQKRDSPQATGNYALQIEVRQPCCSGEQTNSNRPIISGSTNMSSTNTYTGNAVVRLTQSSTKLVRQSCTLGCLSRVSSTKRE